MSRPRLAAVTSIAAFAIAAAAPAYALDPTQSATVIGANPQLSEGAAALQAGNIEEGIRLTLEGLRAPTGTLDRAAGYSNLCAGYAFLKKWAEALPHCNSAIELDRTNWRAFNNRAGVYTATGRHQLAANDVRSGLEIAPDTPMLLETLRIIEQNRRAPGARGHSTDRTL